MDVHNSDPRPQQMSEEDIEFVATALTTIGTKEHSAKKPVSTLKEENDKLRTMLGLVKYCNSAAINKIKSAIDETMDAIHSSNEMPPNVVLKQLEVIQNEIIAMQSMHTDMDRKDMPSPAITIDSSEYNDVEITSDQIHSGLSCATLQVRRGSEPVLNRMDSPEIDFCDPTKRWSTAVAVDLKSNKIGSINSLDVPSEHSEEDKDKTMNSSKSLTPPSIKEEGYGSEERSEHTPSSTTSNTFSRFSRGSGRLSMIANNLDVWVEAADRQLSKSFHRDRSPVKAIYEVNKNYNSLPKRLNYEMAKTSVSSVSSEDNTKPRSFKDKPTVMIILAKESGPLGIHVVPESDDSHCSNGLLIQGIEPGGRIDRDGRLHVGDVIVEINDQRIVQADFETAQQIFRAALQSDEIVLRLVKYNQNFSPNQNTTEVKKVYPPPVLPKPSNIQKQHEELRQIEGMVEAEQVEGQPTKVATVTSTKMMTPTANQKPALSSALVVGNTRRIGKKYHIQLKKTVEGLGFSITTRDNPTGGNCPIYIKNILPKGAAVEDGRLHPGDRLLEVCGIEMTGKPQSEAVKILRTIPLGTTVDIIVSRQELDMSPSPLMPRPMPPESGETGSAANEREVLTFEIPLNDTGSAGLGVSVKGKTSTSSGQNTDLGIFVKSVIHGGAASKDGRLLTNDQLININGIPLLGMSNSQAMETLRRAMTQGEGPIANPNAITLTVARKSFTPSSLLNNSCHQRNDSLLSAVSNDSFNEESANSSVFYETFYIDNRSKLDDTYGSYRSTDNTVIYRPKSNGQLRDRNDERENQYVCSPKDESPNKSVNQPSNHTVLKQFYLSENQDSNKLYDKLPANHVNRSDVLIERNGTPVGVNTRKPSVADSSVSESHPESAPRDSQLSLSEEDADGFRRDGFGRQSMSEKRHAQLDAKNTDTYRRNKQAKEDKERKLREKGPSDQQMEQRNESVTKVKTRSVPDNSDRTPHELGKCGSPGSCPYHSTQGATKPANNRDMRKSANLETLMKDLQKEQLETEKAFTGPRNKAVRVSRSRETNESFRAAVDRSYDLQNDNENLETMEIVAEEASDSDSGEEEEEEENVNQINPQPHTIPIRGPSGALSMASTQCTATTAASSQMTTEDDTQVFLKKKNSGKKKGFLKTLLKFGSRKGRSSKQKTEREQTSEQPPDRLADRMAIQNAAQMYLLEQERIQMHYKRLMEQQQHHHYQQQQQQQQQQQLQQQQAHHHHLKQASQVSQTAQPTPPARQRSKSAIGERFGGTPNTQPMHSTPTGVTAAQLANHGLINEQVLSRNERMAQLRAQHQRMHVERHRVYPNQQPIYDTYSSMDRKHPIYSNVYAVHERQPQTNPHYKQQTLGHHNPGNREPIYIAHREAQAIIHREPQPSAQRELPNVGPREPMYIGQREPIYVSYQEQQQQQQGPSHWKPQNPVIRSSDRTIGSRRIGHESNGIQMGNGGHRWPPNAFYNSHHTLQRLHQNT